ncbi:Ndufb8, NADH dehydrogenase 19kDa subunit [Gloeopeniophorella convolvens]|nr:Ndufb8, NADH dehydrogenase 19kDa subunit [Gloeopeniophorella convolvens]
MSLHALRASLRTPAGALPRSHLSRTYATATAKEVDPQLNGYPQLPNEFRQNLPPKGWWDIQMRRNFGDTMHEREEMYSMWGPDAPHVPPSTALNHFAIALTGFVTFGLLCRYALVPDRPAVPRQYPFNGLVKELGGLEENKANVEALEEED